MRLGVVWRRLGGIVRCFAGVVRASGNFLRGSWGRLGASMSIKATWGFLVGLGGRFVMEYWRRLVCGWETPRRVAELM